MHNKPYIFLGHRLRDWKKAPKYLGNCFWKEKKKLEDKGKSGHGE